MFDKVRKYKTCSMNNDKYILKSIKTDLKSENLPR